MSRFSRFEKLETNRRPKPEQEETQKPAHHQRFEGAPSPPSSSPSTSAAPTPGPDIARFAQAQSEALRTDDNPLAELPTLECPICHGETGKFEVACHRCGHRMTSEEAVALNLERLAVHRERLKTEKEQEQLRRAQELQEFLEQKDTERTLWAHFAKDIEKRYRFGTVDFTTTPTKLGMAVTLVFLAWVFPWFLVKIICLAIATALAWPRLKRLWETK